MLDLVKMLSAVIVVGLIGAAAIAALAPIV